MRTILPVLPAVRRLHANYCPIEVRCHFRHYRGRIWVAKKTFSSYEEALQAAMSTKTMQPYQCSLCEKYHIGHGRKK